VNPFDGVNADAMEVVRQLLENTYRSQDGWEETGCDRILADWRAARGEEAFDDWRWWIGEVDGESFALDFSTRDEAIAAAPRAIEGGDIYSEDGRYEIVEACNWSDGIGGEDDIVWFARQRNKEILQADPS